MLVIFRSSTFLISLVRFILGTLVVQIPATVIYGKEFLDKAISQFNVYYNWIYGLGILGNGLFFDYLATVILAMPYIFTSAVAVLPVLASIAMLPIVPVMIA